jgi:subtilisin family serine protease
LVGLLIAAVGLLATPVSASGRGQNVVVSSATDAPTSVTGVDTSAALVQLMGDPLSTSTRTRPAKGKKIDFSAEAVKSERAQLSAERNDFKSWLRANASRARVTSEYDISLNAVAVKLNGESLDVIAAAPMVSAAQYQALYQPTAEDPDLATIHAKDAWARGGATGKGDGVKVAIVDTGIDPTHPCFSDAGYPSQSQLGDHRFTNNKVIVAKVFYNKAAVQGLTPEAVQSHGTHVAGTVGCNQDTPATVNGVPISYTPSGVAPRALLGNYNVFPGTVASARSEDILNALEAAYADGFDVANMSLGGDSFGIDDLLSDGVDDLDQANMVVAVAAGNSGPGHETVESPGKAARALTAGASTAPHFIGAPLTVGGATRGLAIGDFATVDADLTAPLGVVAGSVNGLGTACSPLPAGSLSGDIAVVTRGVCAFSTKIRNAQAAGAAAAVVVNNVAGDPTAMGSDGTPDQPTIPAYMASLADAATLVAADGANATIGTDLAYLQSANVDIMAGFSSQGPTDVDFRVKPDVVAPGVNVLSSVPANACATPPCWAFFQGTSMATPHLAGSAAVVLGQHPDWSAAQVRSAIVNTADQGVLKDFQSGVTTVTDMNVVGAGRENLLSAVGAVAGLDPVSTSFGAVPSQSGGTGSATVTVTNLSISTATFAFTVDPASGSGVTFSVSSSGLTLPPGASGTLTLTMRADKRASAGDHQASLRVSSSGTEVAHAAVYTFAK